MSEQPRSQADAALMPQPAGTALTLPANCYTQPAFADAERRAVFARSWQLVAHGAQVNFAGDHAVAEVAGVPLLAVRGDDGVLRALHNVCRHRAGPLAECDGRHARELVCRYHGWRYALDGRLLGAPDMGRAPDFDVTAIRLPQARVAQWQGLVFAALDDAAPPFEQLVEAIEARLGGRSFADLRCALYGRPERPAVCTSLRPSVGMCGGSAAEAMSILAALETATGPRGPRPSTEGT